MKMNRMIAFILAAVMLLSLTACGKGGAGGDDVSALKAENAQLKEEIAVLSARLAELETSGFKSWKMTARAWGDSNGATVGFIGEPRAYQDGQSAQFVIRLNGTEVENISCQWNGTEFTAETELEAADGYSYSLILVDSNGTREQILLSSPDSPVYDNLVYMRSSLTAYCNLFVADWEVNGNDLKITSGFVQVQLPQITADSTKVEFVSAQLVLQLNGNVVSTQTLDLPEGEGAGSYESALTDVAFAVPEMKDDYQLDLDLHVKLSTGEEIVTSGGSWFYNNGSLSMVVG